jgi:hypothetical protein
MALSDTEVMFNEALGYIGEYNIEDTAASRASKQYIACNRYFTKSRDMALASHPWKEATKSLIILQNNTPPLLRDYDRRYSKPSDSLRILSVDDSLGSDLRNKAMGVDGWELEGEYILSNAGETPPTWATTTDYYDGEFISVTPDTWVTATSLIDGQYVKSGTLIYEVLTDHTSSTIAADITSGNLAAGITGTTVTYEVLVTHTSNTVVADITAGNIATSGDTIDARIVYIKYVWQLTDTTKFSTHLREAIAVQLASKVITDLTNDTKGKVDLINEFERLTSPKARSIDGSQRKPKPIFSSEWIRSRRMGTYGW